MNRIGCFLLNITIQQYTTSPDALSTVSSPAAMATSSRGTGRTSGRVGIETSSSKGTKPGHSSPNSKRQGGALPSTPRSSGGAGPDLWGIVPAAASWNALHLVNAGTHLLSVMLRIIVGLQKRPARGIGSENY